MIPVVNPAGVAELLEFGLLGFALSRYSGCWVGLKCVHDTVNTAASIELDPARVDDPRARRLRAAAGRAQHPLAGHAARPGGAPASLQAGGGARVRPHQLVRPAGVRQPARAPRHRLDRQVVPGPAPGARRPRHRPRDGRPAWPARAQARPGLAARARAHARVRRRPRADRRGRGEARPDRDAAEGAAVRPGGRAADRGQAGRARCAAVPLARRAVQQSGGACARRAHPEARSRRYRRRPPRRAAPAPRRRAGADQPDPAHAVFLLGLPAQHLDPGAGRQHRARRDRLPLHGAVDGPRQYGLHPDGRRGRQLGRRGAVLDARPRVPEPRRRHLLPFRQHGHPRRGRGRRQHHVQDPVQRRGRDDRRPERGWPAVGAADHPRGAGRGRQAASSW